jgi:hypothetical protein
MINDTKHLGVPFEQPSFLRGRSGVAAQRYQRNEDAAAAEQRERPLSLLYRPIGQTREWLAGPATVRLN